MNTELPDAEGANPGLDSPGTRANLAGVGVQAHPRPFRIKQVRWTAAMDGVLTYMWGLGAPTVTIGVSLDMSKNAVIGRAHRLKLPKRPSPIIPRPKTAIKDLREPVGCRFIFGHVGDEDWRYCQKPGEPWCPEHRAIVYTKPVKSDKPVNYIVPMPFR